jgi:hypothetical protein
LFIRPLALIQTTNAQLDAVPLLNQYKYRGIRETFAESSRESREYIGSAMVDSPSQLRVEARFRFVERGIYRLSDFRLPLCLDFGVRFQTATLHLFGHVETAIDRAAERFPIF